MSNPDTHYRYDVGNNQIDVVQGCKRTAANPDALEAKIEGPLRKNVSQLFDALAAEVRSNGDASCLSDESFLQRFVDGQKLGFTPADFESLFTRPGMSSSFPASETFAKILKEEHDKFYESLTDMSPPSSLLPMRYVFAKLNPFLSNAAWASFSLRDKLNISDGTEPNTNNLRIECNQIFQKAFTATSNGQIIDPSQLTSL